MAELIDKRKLVEAMVLSHAAHANNSREASLLNRDLRIVMEQQTTTEAEIRAKAIDEFAECLSLGISESLIWGMLADFSKDKAIDYTSEKIVDYVIDTAKEIAEQLKEE